MSKTKSVRSNEGNATTFHRNKNVGLVLLMGVVLRTTTFLFGSSLFVETPELSSPLVSYSRLQDGIALKRDGVSPYSGDTFHFHPVMLSLLASLDRTLVFCLFTVLDCITGIFLAKSASLFVDTRSPDMEVTVLKWYLLNPITVISTTIASISVLYNLLFAVFLYAFAVGTPVLASLLLSLLIYFCVYPVVLLGSMFLRFPSTRERMLSLCVVSAGFCTMLLLNYLVNNQQWDFIDNTYGFMLRVDDLTPNCGIFWYFFTQVFTHFRSFYVAIFQINLLVYVVPLLLALRKDPFLHVIITFLLLAVFSPYPTLNDASIYFALLPSLEKYWKQPIRFLLLVSLAIVSCIVLMPVMWHMWIVNSSGNANFYFAVTITYNVAQIYLMMDLLFAYFRSETESVCGEVVEAKTTFVFH